MKNAVLGVEHDVARRGVTTRLNAYADEVRRLIDAAYAVMRTTGSIDPPVRDIVATARLSNAAFYRHFESKDALLLAVLEDGRRRLLETLQRRMDAAEPGAPRIEAWMEGVLEQARNTRAAENTRPFAVNGPRLRDRFPIEQRDSVERLVAPLRAALVEAGSTAPERDASAIYDLTFGLMNQLLIDRRGPARAEIEHLVAFARRGITAEPKGRRSGT